MKYLADNFEVAILIACLVLLALFSGCRSTGMDGLEITHPSNLDEWHGCIFDYLTLFANESAAMASVRGRSVGRDGLSRDVGDGVAQSKESVTIEQNQFATVVAVCSVTQEQVRRWVDMRLDCYEQLSCEDLLPPASLFDRITIQQ